MHLWCALALACTARADGPRACSLAERAWNATPRASAAERACAMDASAAIERGGAPRQPNPPRWPDSVTVFGPDDDDVAATIAALSTTLNDRAAGHFSDERRAFLFKPGAYEIDEARIGYYVQVAGLGRSPGDVVISGRRGVFVDAMDPLQAGSLDTFWRAAENFRHASPGGFRWAVSQAAPLRRVVVDGDLELFDPTAAVNYASGGFVADAVVRGRLLLGSQQQWLARNTALGRGAAGGAWSNVFVGCTEAVPAATDDDVEPRVSVAAAAPVVAAKPFVVVDEDGTYALAVPELRRNAVGPDLAEAPEIPFEDVFVADAATHASTDIQSALDAGLHVVLAPGVFYLDEPLRIARPGAVVLGLGLATLVAPPDGGPCVAVDDRGGVRLAGVVLQASAAPTRALLAWRGPGSATAPSVLSDVFARVGGPGATDVRADVMAEVAAAHAVLDHVWLWRADHAELAVGEAPRAGEQYHLVVGDECACDNGLVVDGDDVTAYGLAVEHAQRDQVVWRGERGRVYFYQSELPYEVDQRFGDAGFAGYKVSPDVLEHSCLAAGVYSFFRDHPCLVDAAIVAPETAAFPNAFAKKLRAHDGILAVVATTGPPANWRHYAPGWVAKALAALPYF